MFSYGNMSFFLLDPLWKIRFGNTSGKTIFAEADRCIICSSGLINKEVIITRPYLQVAGKTFEFIKTVWCISKISSHSHIRIAKFCIGKILNGGEHGFKTDKLVQKWSFILEIPSISQYDGSIGLKLSRHFANPLLALRGTICICKEKVSVPRFFDA